MRLHFAVQGCLKARGRGPRSGQREIGRWQQTALAAPPRIDMRIHSKLNREVRYSLSTERKTGFAKREISPATTPAGERRGCLSGHAHFGKR